MPEAYIPVTLRFKFGKISRIRDIKQDCVFTPQSGDEQPGGGTSSQHGQDLKSEGVQAGGTLTSAISKSASTSMRPERKEHLHHIPKSVDYGDGNDSVSAEAARD